MNFFRNKSTELQAKYTHDLQLLSTKLDIAVEFVERVAQGRMDKTFLDSLAAISSEDNTFYQTLCDATGKVLQIAQEDEQRKWIAQGLDIFVGLLRRTESDSFYDQILSALIGYLKANQGGIFIYNDELAQLELVACYAYSRKKYEQRTISLGEGLLGQCFLEKESIYLTEIPTDYVRITSGLGDATPKNLILIPLIYNQVIIGVMELASFRKFEPYHVQFMEKIAESIASASINVSNAKRTQQLLNKAEENAHALLENQEELKQNIEELEVTQEGINRKQIEMDAQSTILKLILDSIPIPVFVKDESGNYTIVNTAQIEVLGVTEKEILGNTDRAFTLNEEDYHRIKESDEAVLNARKPLELPLQHFSTRMGKSFFFKTTKIPFYNQYTKQYNIVGVSIDLTEKLTLEKKMLDEKLMEKNNALIDVAGRQRMLSQKIGFLSEMVARGKYDYIANLKSTVLLYDESLRVLKVGGLPPQTKYLEPFSPAEGNFLVLIERVELVWEVYKTAVQNLIMFCQTPTEINRESLNNELDIIEDYGEKVLKANQELVMEFSMGFKK